MAMKILSDNAADRAVVTAFAAVSGMGSGNLKSDMRGQFCRIGRSSTQIMAKWAQPVIVGAVVLPQSTLGPGSSIRVRVYADEAGTVLVWDSGQQWAVEPSGGNLARSGNDFAYCVAASVAVYLQEQLAAQCVVIDVADPGASVIDIGRLLIGPWIEPRLGPSYGQTSQLVDMSTHTRTASGSLRTDRGPVARSLNFSLAYIERADRGRIQQLLEQGLGCSIWVSLCAGDADKQLERDKAIYGRLMRPSAMRWSGFWQHAADFQIEGL